MKESITLTVALTTHAIELGDIVSVTVNGRTDEWRVQRILDRGRVVLGHCPWHAKLRSWLWVRSLRLRWGFWRIIDRVEERLKIREEDRLD
jgi:hypothetical protein